VAVGAAASGALERLLQVRHGPDESTSAAQLDPEPAPEQLLADLHRAGADSRAEPREPERDERPGADREQADGGARLGADDRCDELAWSVATWVRTLHG
jgi:hypothetical protein